MVGTACKYLGENVKDKWQASTVGAILAATDGFELRRGGLGNLSTFAFSLLATGPVEVVIALRSRATF